MYVLDAMSGDIHWTYDTGSQVKCSPVVDTLTGYMYIYCLDIKVSLVIKATSLN